MRKILSFKPALPLLVLFLSALTPILAIAQTRKQGIPPGIKLRPKAGEEVEIYYLGDWRPARVLEASKTQIAVEYEWVNRLYQKKFPLNEVRYPWQANAMSPVYNWKDQSGSFSVKAAVMDFDRDKRTVTLYNLEKNTEITVPVDKLSDADKTRLKRIVDSAPMKITPPPPLEQFQKLSFGRVTSWNPAVNLAEVSPDPPRNVMNFPDGGAAFPKLGFWDSLNSVYPIGTESGWMAAAAGSDNFDQDEFPARLVWATLADGKIRKVQSLAHGESLMAVDAASQRVLTVGKEGREWTLAVWTASPKTDKATPIVRWVSHKDVFSRKPFAEFVGENRVIHRWGDSQYIVWDFVQRRAVYEVKQESFFDAPPVISPGKRYLALPEDKGVRILSAADGETLASLPIGTDRASGVAFDAKGEKLAVLSKNQLMVWKLGSADPPETYVASAVGSPFGQRLAWVDDRTLLVDGKTLFDLDRELPIWTYSAAFGEVSRSGFNEVSKIAGGRLCYGVTLREGGSGGAFVIGAVELPGKGVSDTVERIDEEKLWTLGPGSTVRIETNCGNYNQQVRNALMRAAEAAGWSVQPNGQFTLRAEMGRSKSQTITYERQGTGQTETVTVTPYFSNLSVTEGQTRIWSSGSSSGGAPSFMWVRDGESIQSKVSQTERADPDFFNRVKLPGRILHPRYKGGFGTSVYSKVGLTAKPMENLPLKP